MPIVRLLVRLTPLDDPWERHPRAIEPHWFGAGSQRDFRWYFEGASGVQAASVDDICQWLLECRYVTDPAQFNSADHWQHPTVFEAMRQGDCEDYALWAWRKLAELGIEAELVSGKRIVSEGEGHSHAWVLFRDRDTEFVLEAVSHTRERMVLPADEVRDEYRPHVGINTRFETTMFGGYLLTMQEKRKRPASRTDHHPSYAMRA